MLEVTLRAKSFHAVLDSLHLPPLGPSDELRQAAVPRDEEPDDGVPEHEDQADAEVESVGQAQSGEREGDDDYCSDSDSRGADLNRNFDFQWGCCGGSSSWERSSTYRGPSPASEPEIQALQASIATIFPDQRPDELVTPAPEDATGVAIDVHSYGRLLPYT